MMNSTAVRPRAWLQGPAATVVAVRLWIATVGNIALWRRLSRCWKAQAVRAWPPGWPSPSPAALALLMSGLVWRRTLKPMLVLALLVTAGASHFPAAVP
jgi:lipid A ethanolaminephosphotransferase